MLRRELSGVAWNRIVKIMKQGGVAWSGLKMVAVKWIGGKKSVTHSGVEQQGVKGVKWSGVEWR